MISEMKYNSFVGINPEHNTTTIGWVSTESLLDQGVPDPCPTFL